MDNIFVNTVYSSNYIFYCSYLANILSTGVLGHPDTFPKMTKKEHYDFIYG